GAHWRSAMVAALFGLHPLHVQSVAWIAERKDVLSALFFLLTIWAYGRYGQETGDRRQETGAGKVSSVEGRGEEPLAHGRGSRITHHASRLYLLALLFFALGLMSKPMLVTLPFVLLLLDYWPLRRVTGNDCRAAGVARASRITHHASSLSQLLVEKLP